MPLSDIGNNSALHKRTDQLKPIKIKFDGSDANREPKHLYTNGQSNDVVVLKPRREIVIDELQKEFDIQLDKIALINDFMSLHCERDKIKGKLVDLKSRTVEMKMFLNDARRKIEIFKTVQMPQTQSLIDSMRQQHLKMLDILDGLDNSEKDEPSTSVQSNVELIVILLPSCTVVTHIIFHFVGIDNDNNASPMVETPKIQSRQTFVIAGRMNTITPKRHQSPFVIRVNPGSLCKLSRQFEIDIDRSEFDKIPKYLKGRDSIGEENQIKFSYAEPIHLTR